MTIAEAAELGALAGSATSAASSACGSSSYEEQSAFDTFDRAKLGRNIEPASAAWGVVSSQANEPVSKMRPNRSSNSELPAEESPAEAAPSLLQQTVDRLEGTWRAVASSRREPAQQLREAAGECRQKAASETWEPQEGDEVQRLEGGFVYEGQLQGTIRHGQGRCRWDRGDCYEGQFFWNDLHGEGQCRFSDHSVYKGLWERNHMGPTGELEWSDGRRYEGEFVDSKGHGHGRLTWPSGKSYLGQWEHGRQHGLGVTASACGSRWRLSLWSHGRFVHWLDPSANSEPASALSAAIAEREEAQRRRQAESDPLALDGQATPGKRFTLNRQFWSAPAVHSQISEKGHGRTERRFGTSSLLSPMLKNRLSFMDGAGRSVRRSVTVGPGQC